MLKLLNRHTQKILDKYGKIVPKWSVFISPKRAPVLEHTQELSRSIDKQNYIEIS